VTNDGQIQQLRKDQLIHGPDHREWRVVCDAYKPPLGTVDWHSAVRCGGHVITPFTHKNSTGFHTLEACPLAANSPGQAPEEEVA
jgi:hypothetical protein